jgi:predicted phage tail protein
MRTIHLYGALAKHVKSIKLDVRTAAEAVRALCANFPAMRSDINDGKWSLVRGSKKTGMSLDETEVTNFGLGSGDLHFIPNVSGAKGNNNGALKVILGATLIAVSFGFASALATPILGIAGASTYGSAMAMAGLGMVLTGASTLLSPKTSSSDETKSYTFSGPTGSAQQGVGVPIVYGEAIVGSVMISGGFDVDQLKAL